MEWENKIDPVLFELGKIPGLQRASLSLDGGKVAFSGNDQGFLQFLKNSGHEEQFKQAQLYIYVYGGLTDLAILRRLKEYPDETSRSEIEEYWLAESVEGASIIIINPEKA